MRRHSSHIGSLVMGVLSLLAFNTAASAATIYVRPGVAGDGTSWASAGTLQSALARAVSGDEIWVAAGVYKPTTTADRTVSFAMKSGVAVYGGFAGTEPADFDLARRNLAAHPTILSGDLLGDDGPDFANVADNSYSVVIGEAVGASAVLDGFTITGGEADDHDSFPVHGSSGAGIFLNAASPSIRNCQVIRNRAWIGGGGLCALSSLPNVTGCRFEDNHVLNGAAGAVLNYNGSNSQFTKCSFVGNTAKTYGGAMYNVISRTRLVNCGFFGNSAEQSGGALSEFQGPSTITNCLFSGNKAENHDDPPLETFGGAVVTQMSNLTLTNCTFRGNSASVGGGVVNGASMANWPTLKNCIFWDNPGGEIATAYTAQFPEVSWSDVKGGAVGDGNIGANLVAHEPRFADADGPDDILGTADDNLHLLAGSPCIDAGRNADVPPGAFTDLLGAPRFFDDPASADCRWLPGTCGAAPIVDMGAYEFRRVPGDGDHDGDIDDLDLAAFEACASGPAIARAADCMAWDLDADNDVDQDDFGVLQRCYSGAGKPADPECAD